MVTINSLLESINIGVLFHSCHCLLHVQTPNQVIQQTTQAIIVSISYFVRNILINHEK